MKFSAWCVWDVCRVQRSRGKDVHWPMQLSTRIAPGPATRASGFRQRSADAALRRNLNKAKKGWGPLAVAPPGATGSASEELALRPPSGGGYWLTAPEDPGRSTGSWQTWSETPGGRSCGSWQIAPDTPRGSWQAQTWWSSQGWQNWPNE